jgi:iron complex outermembrane recepter protein
MNVVFAVFLALLCTAAPARAQAPGGLAGSIYDQTGAPLPGVRVAIRGVTDRRAETSVAGNFVFDNLPEGDYEISAELRGFERQGRPVRVRAGERVSLSFTLRVAVVAETIVTADKAGGRDIQETPIAITAVAQGDLGRLGTQTIEGAPILAPAVTFSQNTGWGQLTIRGIGTNLLIAGSDPSSAIYLDGVYLARPAMAFVRFLDLDRIEVLRGPQGTLYGRNAVGGAMNLIPRAPTNDFQASAGFTAGSFGELRADARMSGPLKRDRVMGSVAFARSVRDGFVRDLEHTDNPLGGDNDTAARAQLRVVFDRRTSLLLSSDVDRQRGVPLTYNKVLVAKPGYLFDNPADFHDVRTSLLAWNDTQHYGATARLTMALAPATTLVSLTALRALDYEFVVDSDITELDLIRTHQLERQHQLSQEITIAHQQPRLTWVAGMFLFSESDHQTIWSYQPAGPFERRLDPRVDATSRAAFGQATVGLTARLSATAGVRYTHEGKDTDNAGGRYTLEAPILAIPGSVYGYTDSIADGAWTPKFGLEMKLPNGALTYVSATRGFKSGGFNSSSTTPGNGYAPEWAWSYEGGWKGTLMGGRSRFATSAFIMDYTNLQVQTPIGIGVFDIRNAAAATIRGIEVEGTSLIGHGIQAGGHLAWLDATYDRYIAVSVEGTTGDVSGNRLNNAPEWAGRLWIEWVGNVGTLGRLSISGESTSQSTVFYTPFNDGIQRQSPYGLLGARIEYGPADRRWTVGAYGRNLTNADYVTATFGTPPNAYGGRPGPSRQLAVDFTLRR